MGSLIHGTGSLITNTTDYTQYGSSIKLKYSGVYLVTAWSAAQSSIRLENDGGFDTSTNVYISSTPVSFDITYPEVKSITADNGQTNIAIKRIAQ